MHRQGGAALLTAMLIVAMVSSLAAGMVWRQYRAVQIEAAERARAQASWMLRGALDWARLILAEDARPSGSEPPTDHLGEPWAVPLAEARLSTFLAADKGNTDDGPEAFLSGSIQDAQAQYNLRNLAVSEPNSPAATQELATLVRLCESAGLSSDVATQLAQKLRLAFAKNEDKRDGLLQPKSLAQLSWLGLQPESIQRLRPWVTLLPTATPVNLNTAPREVIAALFNTNLAIAEKIVQARQAAPLRSPDELRVFLPPDVQLGNERAAVRTEYFIVMGRLRLDERVLEERSLVRRVGREIQVVNRERVNLVLETSP
ncbi:type II secretion system minor pseudopilin GspK [Paucibacter soli]|uniref:type II secretion system minor pseudopilin GspK n=1 Tax=Paucibacter soli TaxID=3133433 RepID=UPI00309ABC40